MVEELQETWAPWGHGGSSASESWSFQILAPPTGWKTRKVSLLSGAKRGTANAGARSEPQTTPAAHPAAENNKPSAAAPPQFQLRKYTPVPVLGKKEGATQGIEDGFEGGRFLRDEDGRYHYFPAERMRRGSGQGNGTFPSDLMMQLGHWVSDKPWEPGSWRREGTVFRSSGRYDGTDRRASLFEGIPVWDAMDGHYHFFYVAYTMAPMNGSHAYVQYDGEIMHAIAEKPGKQGLGGPYKDIGAILTLQDPGTDTRWEGDQGDDAFFPYQLRNGSWVAFFGSALTRQKSKGGGWNHDWYVGLAQAGNLGLSAAKWEKLNKDRNPVRFGNTGWHAGIENPIVTGTQDGEWYVAVYFDVLSGGVGAAYSRDGLEWLDAGHLNLTPGPAKPCGPDRLTTALGLVPEPSLGKGMYSLLFTGRGGEGAAAAGDPKNAFENVCYALLENVVER